MVSKNHIFSGAHLSAFTPIFIKSDQLPLYQVRQSYTKMRQKSKETKTTEPRPVTNEYVWVQNRENATTKKSMVPESSDKLDEQDAVHHVVPLQGSNIKLDEQDVVHQCVPLHGCTARYYQAEEDMEETLSNPPIHGCSIKQKEEER
ncbi:unnamed protein product [Vicia faba]|uniref:Late embryogenesis abundant protein n=1 Tax=Vicia faba TaxID=3906 RepID=A0AAV1A6U5_VICFA|nr:unnamed protein product [Vicia faba]